MRVGGVSRGKPVSLQFVQQSQAEIQRRVVLMSAAVVTHNAGDGGINLFPAVAFLALAGSVISGFPFGIHLLLVDSWFWGSFRIHRGVPAGISAGGM